MSVRGQLFVVSGPAGAGKTAIVKRLIEKHPDVGVSVSCTTRPPRADEVHGVHYHFVSDAEFDELIESGSFYEWAHVHEHRYGTLKHVVDEELQAGHDLILEIDVQGCLKAMEQDSSVVGIFICPPSRENMEKRLRARKSESENSFAIRIKNAFKEIEKAYRYDYIIINQDWDEVEGALDMAVEQAYAIITAMRLKTSKCMGFLNELTSAFKN